MHQRPASADSLTLIFKRMAAQSLAGLDGVPSEIVWLEPGSFMMCSLETELGRVVLPTFLGLLDRHR